MGSSLHVLSLFLFLTFPPTNTHPFCHQTESSALLHFKNSFVINISASSFPSSHPKLSSWDRKGGEEETSDCCSWEGVECDDHTGHVIGLDLSSSSLFGSISSNSTLFHLVHLQSLNLADNHFNYSTIPSKLGLFSSLTHLNLSDSVLSGQIPLNISRLTKLTSLDLSYNDMLVLENPNLGGLVRNLSCLEKLHLSEINMSSEVPHVLANLSSLRSVKLEKCGLIGEFPSRIFNLPHLQHLNVMYNTDLTGFLPDFQWTSPLETLWLVETSFSGMLPSSIGNIASMVDFDIWSCQFHGSIPTNLLNLTRVINLGLGDNSFSGQFPSFLANLTNLEVLTLGLNRFHGADLFWATKLTKLKLLHLTKSNIYGEIPNSFGNLTHLTSLLMSYNQISGVIPLELLNLSHLTHLGLNFNQISGEITIPSRVSKRFDLTYLDLSFNKLTGQIPSEVFELEKLTYLDLSFNNLSGRVELGMFLGLKNLSILHLSGNSLSLDDDRERVRVLGFPSFRQLGLSSCNLSWFPSFIRSQDELEWLELAHNNIHGSIPTWIWNTSAQTLLILNLSSNFLTGFDHKLPVLPPRLVALDLSHNLLKGSLPNPPPTTLFFSTSNNSLSGNISPLVCNMTSLQALDLSENELGGHIPQCLGSFSHSLSVLNLRGNNLEGPLPQRWTRSSLKMINLSENKLEGPLPRSLAKCKMLESLDISDNKINDSFPYWLGSLPELKILLLRSNFFRGEIRTNLDRSSFSFCKLRIIDLSYNHFSGDLPYEFFLNWNPLKNVSENHLTYLQIYLHYKFSSAYVTDFIWDVNYVFSLTMVNKGLMMEYEKIQELFTAVDFSSNDFHGDIPKSIGHMKELYLLNLSNNFLTGRIPEILGDLTGLESLDVSHNKLSGQIPEKLAQLTFLEIFNVSSNNLTGPIPHGQQFNTFQSNSFDGNPGLCGAPLTNECTNLDGLPPLTLVSEEDDDQDSESIFCFDIKIVLVGYASGIVVGAIIGNIMFKREYDWFMRIFRWRKHKFS